MRNTKNPSVPVLFLALLGAALPAAPLVADSGPGGKRVAFQAGPSSVVEAGKPPATVTTLLEAPTAVGTCTGIKIVTTSGRIFTDGFESGDTTRWGWTPSPADPTPWFSARQIVDLQFEVLFADGSAGEHLLQFKLITPRGHHYQTLTVPVTGETASPGTLRKVDGYPYPLAIQRMTSTSSLSGGETGVSLGLPVAGTAIVASSLYGQWTAEAFMDDETVACAAASFELSP